VCVCVCERAARLLDSIHKIRFICTPSIKEELKFFTESRYLFKSIVLCDRSENFSPWTCQRMLTNPYLLVLSRRGHRNRLISSQENAVFIILMVGFLKIFSWKVCSKLGWRNPTRFNCTQIYLLLNYSTCFWRPSRPSSGVHKTVVTACGMYRSNYLGSKVLQTWPKVTFEEPCLWSIPEAATSDLYTPDDGWDGRPKHVE